MEAMKSLNEYAQDIRIYCGKKRMTALKNIMRQPI
jgi:hypothetical protein